MYVSEIFTSIQGEGPNVGTPAIFLRTSGCNLRCKYCDTKYAWNKNKYLKETEVCNMIHDLISKYHYVKLLVVTGGEPLLQQSSLVKILTSLDNLYVEVETNGTVDIEEEDIFRYVSSWIVSPKLSNSGNDSSISKVRDIWFSTENTYFKFVVSGIDDFWEVVRFVEDKGIDEDNVYIMPMCTKTREHNDVLRSIWYHTVQYGFKLSPRLHILAFEGIRGV